LIQKYEKSLGLGLEIKKYCLGLGLEIQSLGLGLGLGLDNKVLFTSLLVTDD